MIFLERTRGQFDERKNHQLQNNYNSRTTSGDQYSKKCVRGLYSGGLIISKSPNNWHRDVGGCLQISLSIADNNENGWLLSILDLPETRDIRNVSFHIINNDDDDDDDDRGGILHVLRVTL